MMDLYFSFVCVTAIEVLSPCNMLLKVRRIAEHRHAIDQHVTEFDLWVGESLQNHTLGFPSSL